MTGGARSDAGSPGASATANRSIGPRVAAMFTASGERSIRPAPASARPPPTGDERPKRRGRLRSAVARDADDPVADRLAAIHDHLAATAERPVTREASAWLGEAEAVAADVATGDPPAAAVERRLADLDHLLGEVDGTGDPVADERLAAARRALADARDAFDDAED